MEGNRELRAEVQEDLTWRITGTYTEKRGGDREQNEGLSALCRRQLQQSSEGTSFHWGSRRSGSGWMLGVF